MWFPAAIDPIAIAAFIALLIWASVSDVRHYLIPNWICAAIALLYVVHVGASPHGVDWLGGLAVGAILFALSAALFVFRIVGGGDVKLLGACALWAGPVLAVPYLAVTAITGGVLALALLARLRLTETRHHTLASVSRLAAGETRTLPKTQPLPYGVAIAVGGLYVAVMLLIK